MQKMTFKMKIKVNKEKTEMTANGAFLQNFGLRATYR